MNKLVPFTANDQKQIVKKRSGETKFGDLIQIIDASSPIYEQLVNLDVTFVIFGIPEDIGSFANNGKSGTYTAWSEALKVLLNMQSNTFNNPSKVLVLGRLDFLKEQKTISNFNPLKIADRKKARLIVANIDKHVSKLMHDIVKAGKKPIVIGGSHSNAYGNIKGTSLALKTPVNAINLDAHANFDIQDGRHSGNAFTYAYNEGFLSKYFIFGMHENQVSQRVLNTIEKLPKKIAYTTFESLYVRKQSKYGKEILRALRFIQGKPFGIEIDCDAIENMPSIAMSSSGLSVGKAREFLNVFSKHKNATYLHICGAAPELASKKTAKLSSKFIGDLITDFIRANGS